ncbi:MAG: energy-coupling factor transporter transmembrane protein EcfT [Proteobacteria bacterium]|nr:energy-coupling factor transporter transmembrane protein EcfT [Pseudomonadota bacterium]MBU4133116.1 energy-coupling factor transporter transmembrane protein EcfT [Pseudomonadota bacterium]
MAALNPFMFRQGNSLLHCLDTRCKLLWVCMTSLFILKADFLACFIFLGVLIVFIKQIQIGVKDTLRQLKLFLLFLGFIFLARALTIPGDPLVFFHGLTITRQGLNQGGLVALRFFLVMVTGLVFSATTRPASLKSAAQWFLKPIPFVPEKRAAVMISLALRFFPLILQQANETANAIDARCGNLQKNPIKRFVRLTLPLLKKTFLSADHLILAMEARCYGEDRTDPEFEPSGKERVFILYSLGFWLFLFFFQYASPLSP